MTSTDLYAYLTTLSIVIVSCFVCWALYYLIQILKRMYALMDAIEDSFKNMSSGWESFMHRFSTMRETLQMLAQGIRTAGSMYEKIKKPSKKKKSIEDTDGIQE